MRLERPAREQVQRLRQQVLLRSRRDDHTRPHVGNSVRLCEVLSEVSDAERQRTRWISGQRSTDAANMSAATGSTGCVENSDSECNDGTQRRRSRIVRLCFLISALAEVTGAE